MIEKCSNIDSIYSHYLKPVFLFLVSALVVPFVPLLVLSPTTMQAQNNCTDNNRGVFFGERSIRLKDNPGSDSYRTDVVRIFMDKKGMYYPELFIGDHEMENNCSSLESWYNSHPGKLDSLCMKYHVPDSLGTDHKIESLNVAIMQHYLDTINSKVKAYDFVNVLIHGFRKKAYGKIDKYSSYSQDEYVIWRKRMSSGEQKCLFVEIYWDGKFITPSQGFKFKGLSLFENAGIPNAANVGLGLRPLIGDIHHDRINIITHSLGARVAGELLFNASGGTLQKENTIATPAQPYIHVCLIAPAIGYEYFANYYSRCTSGNLSDTDNYNIVVVYNENDFVLQKNYGFGINGPPTIYGNTSLGCNYNSDLQHLNALFTQHFPFSALPLCYNFSIGNNGVNMGCHKLTCYVNHKQFAEVLDFLYH